MRKLKLLISGVILLCAWVTLFHKATVFADTSFPATRMVYVEKQINPSYSCNSYPQQFDQFIVTADYPSGANKAYLPLVNHGVGTPAVLGGSTRCPFFLGAPGQLSINPSRTKIAFVRVGSYAIPAVYDVATQREISLPFYRPDGSQAFSNCYQPEWSPDGNYLSCTSSIGIPGVGLRPGLYIWNATTLQQVDSMPFTTNNESYGLYSWLPDSSGVVLLHANNNPGSPGYISCQIGPNSIVPNSFDKFDIATRTISTIKAPSCDPNWLYINYFTVSSSAKIIFETKTFDYSSGNQRGQKLNIVNLDGSGLYTVPMNLNFSISPDGYYCGEDIGDLRLETQADAIIMTVHGPSQLPCDFNEQFINKIERVNVATGNRTVVIDRSSEGYDAFQPTSTALGDSTPPTIIASTSPAPNSAGWNNSNATVTFTCSDSGSGIASCPSPITVSQEGAGQIITGTATDNAGNSASTSTMVNLDKTKPNISYVVSPAPNRDGWNNSDVTVTFNCSDALSGIDFCTAPVTLSTNGSNQTATGTAVDKAGNVQTVTATVNLDKEAPTIDYHLSAQPNSDGWNNSDVTVSFSCSDGVSGIKTCPQPITVSEGTGQIITATATDYAGNDASTSVMLNVDETDPTISYIPTSSSTPNSSGYYTSDITITFNCSDAVSGVAFCSSPVTISNDGANQTVTGIAVDKAGHAKSISTVVNLDKTAPSISASISPAANNNGWNNGNVTVSFTCSDTTSGIAVCPPSTTITQEGAGQIITGTATDNAGNSASASVMVNIDKTTPVVSNLSWTANPLQQGQNTTLSSTVSDNLSSLASVQYSVNGNTPQAMTYDPASNTWKATFGSSLAANTYNITVTATDQAGNTSLGTNDVLAIYTTANGYVTGHAKTLPTSNDVLPIALDTSGNPAKLVVGLTNVTAPTSGSFDLDYSIKNKKDEFLVSSNSINWVVVQDSSHASILGYGDLTTYVNGIKTVTQNVAVRFDLTLGSNGSPDQISIKIYNPGVDPNSGTPAYIINDTDIPVSSNLMIHP